MTDVNVHAAVSTPDELAAIVAILHGHPAEGLMTVAGFNTADQLHRDRIVSMLLADPPEPAYTCRTVPKLLAAARDWDAARVTLIAWAPAEVADPALDLAEGLAETLLPGVQVHSVIRIHQGRFWDYACDAPEYGRDSDGEEYEQVSDQTLAALTDIAAAEMGDSDG